MAGRTAARVTRRTAETDVHVRLGTEETDIEIPVPILSHFLGASIRTWGIGAELKATGDVQVDPHHLAEDVGIVLGQALKEFLPGYAGIARYGWANVPMDDALVEVALDLSGRAGAFLTGLPDGPVGGVDGEVFTEFMHGLCRGAACTLHLRVLAGTSRHHQWEAAFKALGLALRMATEERGEGVLSTKGMIG